MMTLTRYWYIQYSEYLPIAIALQSRPIAAALLLGTPTKLRSSLLMLMAYCFQLAAGGEGRRKGIQSIRLDGYPIWTVSRTDMCLSRPVCKRNQRVQSIGLVGPYSSTWPVPAGKGQGGNRSRRPWLGNNDDGAHLISGQGAEVHVRCFISCGTYLENVPPYLRVPWCSAKQKGTLAPGTGGEVPFSLFRRPAAKLRHRHVSHSLFWGSSILTQTGMVRHLRYKRTRYLWNCGTTLVSWYLLDKPPWTIGVFLACVLENGQSCGSKSKIYLNWPSSLLLTTIFLLSIHPSNQQTSS